MISDEERRERIAAAKREVMVLRNGDAPRTTFWLSFCDGDRPEGDQFLGAAIIPDCVNLVDAMQQAYAHGCNPGGEIAGYELPPQAFEEDVGLRDAPRYTLMSKAELLARDIIREKEPDDDADQTE